MELVKQAQLGDKGSLDSLCELAGQRLYEYVYRCTLQNDLTKDITQECMLEMVQAIGKLKDNDSFWPWLKQMALNKLKMHYRMEKRLKQKAQRSVEWNQKKPFYRKDGDGLENMINQELKESIFTAIASLEPRYRIIINLRCYEKMEYSKIAKALQCSEFNARKIFWRAKKALKNALVSNGLDKGMLMTSLLVFGMMTSQTQATAAGISINAATVKVGATTAMAGALGFKGGFMALIGMLAITAGTVAISEFTFKSKSLPTTYQNNYSYVYESRPTAVLPTEEFWYFYPDDFQSILLRITKGDGPSKQCIWLQNDRANYYYDEKRNSVFVNNYRVWHGDLSVWQLPDDKLEFIELISNSEDTAITTQNLPSTKRGLLVVVNQNSSDNNTLFMTYQNALYDTFFHYDWPKGIKTVERRDEMHRRGWTYFEIKGEVDNRPVNGYGRIPFVYAMYESNYPWLVLNVSSNLQIVDTKDGASLYNSKDQSILSYSSGSFFRGLSRPWIGLHTIDIIRRDAAEDNVLFETIYDPDTQKTQIILNGTPGKAIYTVDMEKDVLEQIVHFSDTEGQNITASLNFNYLQTLNNGEQEFMEPRLNNYSNSKQPSPGIVWLQQVLN